MINNIIGWDIGGAHLKAVLLDAEGRVRQAVQLPCPLWQGMAQLENALDQVLADWQCGAARHAVTMTGELVDAFADRRTGVLQIAAAVERKLAGRVRFYTAGQGLIEPSQAAAQYCRVASANWHASASGVAAELRHDALLLDIGSTTTDIVPLRAGAVVGIGFSDAERLRENELVYSGVVRTPLMALAQSIPFGGYDYRLAAELFATTADVYRVTRELAADADDAPTADGADKGQPASMQRLARMLGHDRADADDAQWLGLARTFRDCQLQQLEAAVTAVLTRARIDAAAPLVAAGCGAFLVEALAARCGRTVLPAAQLIVAKSDSLRRRAAVCFPAYAVARLALAA